MNISRILSTSLLLSALLITAAPIPVAHAEEMQVADVSATPDKIDMEKYKRASHAAAGSVQSPLKAQPVAAIQAVPPKLDIPKLNEKDLTDPDEAALIKKTIPVAYTAPAMPVTDASESEALRISLDSPTVLRLDRDAVNVLVGSNENLRVVPDTNKSIILIPKKPGTTYFQAIDADGKTIMQRHVIIGSPKTNYIRIRRACVNGSQGCQQYSVYYCPDICHEVPIEQTASASNTVLPEETPGSAAPSAAPTAVTAPAEPLANTIPPGQ